MTPLSRKVAVGLELFGRIFEGRVPCAAAGEKFQAPVKRKATGG